MRSGSRRQGPSIGRVTSVLALAGTVFLAACLGEKKVEPLAKSNDLVVAVIESPIVYAAEADDRSVPFEQALFQRFAEQINLPLRVIHAEHDQEIRRLVQEGKAHIGAGWLTEPELAEQKPLFRLSVPFHRDSLVIVQHDASLAIASLDQLSGKTVHVASGSRYADAALLLKRQIPSLTIVEHTDESGVDLARAVAEEKVELIVVAREVAKIAQNYYPQLQITLSLADAQPIGWLFSAQGDPTIAESANTFLDNLEADGTLARLRDSHLAFRRRLDRSDVIDFISRVRTTLPLYHGLFKQAQIRTGIDWRLLAALSYQESKWDPLATSFTGVRGMMMLTEDTADRMRVKDRLDPKESVLAGADYLAALRDELPGSVKEPDRTWLALAAYNLGMGHMNGARAIALGYKANPDDWYEMKKILPMLARPEIYARLKSGRARGGEAVILVENIRAYYDILTRHVPAYQPLPDAEPEAEEPPRRRNKLNPGSGPGLKTADSRSGVRPPGR
jgi:membrane-bound lytic murein transglycosylase F